MGRFTVEDVGAVRVTSDCKVDVSYYNRDKSRPSSLHCDKVVWDTGASVSVISERVAAELGLRPTGITKVAGFNGKWTNANTYRIDISFSEDVKVGFVEVVETSNSLFDLLIGMDIISQGDFHITKPPTRTLIFEL